MRKNLMECTCHRLSMFRRTKFHDYTMAALTYAHDESISIIVDRYRRRALHSHASRSITSITLPHVRLHGFRNTFIERRIR